MIFAIGVTVHGHCEIEKIEIYDLNRGPTIKYINRSSAEDYRLFGKSREGIAGKDNAVKTQLVGREA
jgi:hypothetical protein